VTPGEVMLVMMWVFLACGGLMFVKAKDPEWRQTHEFLRDPLWYILIGMGGFAMFAYNLSLLLLILRQQWMMVNVYGHISAADQLAWTAFFGMVSVLSLYRLYSLEKRGLIRHDLHVQKH
jgi:hypothetical protein